MKTNLSPSNKEHFEELIPFAQKIILLCRENGINPIVYGGFAHLYYTKDASLSINDIDLLIPKREFARIIKEIKLKIPAEIVLDGDTLVVKSGKIIVELDGVNDSQFKELQNRSGQMDFYGIDTLVINLKDLEAVYPLAFKDSTRYKGKVLEKIISLENFLRRKLKGFNMKNKEVCLEIYKTFSKTPEVLAIFNNGSSIVDMDETGSDMDFVIVVRKTSDEKKIRGLFRKNYRILKNEEDPGIAVEEQYEVLGKRVDPTIITKDEIQQKIDKIYSSVENYLTFQHFVKHKIIDSISLYDPNKLLVKWKKEAERYPKAVMKDVFNSQIHSIKENLFYWKNHGFRNEFQFGFEQWDLIQAICQALYAKNNQMFMLPYKRLHKDLKKLKPNIEKEMYALVRGRNTPRRIQRKIKIVEKIVSKLEG